MEFTYDANGEWFLFEKKNGDGSGFHSWLVALEAIQTMTLMPYGEGHISTDSDSLVLFTGSSDAEAAAWKTARKAWLEWRGARR